MIDLNTLIPSNPNLSLVLGATMDDAGAIVGYAYDQTAGTLPAFVAIPGFFLKDHQASPAVSEAAPRVSMPESVRTLVQQKLRSRGLRRIGPN